MFLNDNHTKSLIISECSLFAITISVNFKENLRLFDKLVHEIHQSMRIFLTAHFRNKKHLELGLLTSYSYL